MYPAAAAAAPIRLLNGIEYGRVVYRKCVYECTQSTNENEH